MKADLTETIADVLSFGSERRNVLQTADASSPGLVMS